MDIEEPTSCFTQVKHPKAQGALHYSLYKTLTIDSSWAGSDCLKFLRKLLRLIPLLITCTSMLHCCCVETYSFIVSATITSIPHTIHRHLLSASSSISFPFPLHRSKSSIHTNSLLCSASCFLTITIPSC